MPEILQSFDVFAHPSVSSESFGVAVLEASACGLPVVATRVGGVPEVCIDRKTGFLVPPLDSDALAQAIILLAKDSKLSQRMANAGRSFVLEKYVWGVNVKRMLSVFENLIST
ncbi:GDP-mannose-dependent alpha-(1-6)-phosphatidylinositol monomannoside mannosyltransferase [subsurface metagenome]